jgi:hypothetical protein
MPVLLTPAAALGALLTVWAITTALYLLKSRRRRVVVAFMPLWEALLKPEPTTRLFGRLRRAGSLLIALTITGLLVLALTDPKLGAIGRAPRSMLVLIDAAQHMQTRDVAPSRLERARRLAEQLVAAKATNDELLIAQMDASPTPLGPASTDPASLLAALQRLTATDAATDFDAALRFASQVLAGHANPVLVVISDGAFGADTSALRTLRAQGIALHHLLLGTDTRNVGIRSFSARRYAGDQSHSELMLELENAGARVEHVELTLLGDDSALALDNVELAPHSLTTRFYGDIAGHAQRLEARIALQAGPDPLPNDDRAYALLPPETRSRVLLVTHGNRYLEAGLLLDASHAVTVLAPSAYQSARGYDVVVFDGYAPAESPGVPCLFIAPPSNATEFPFQMRGVVERPRFETAQREHVLLQHVVLRDVNIARAARVVLQKGDQVVAGAAGVPLIVTGTRAGQPFVALGFDVRESDLPLRVAWPLLLTHVLDFLRPLALDYQPSLEVGAQQRVPIPNGALQASVRAPSGASERLAVQQQAVWLRPLRAGFYRLESSGEAQAWAANRDPARSVSIAAHALPLANPKPPAVQQSWFAGEAWLLLLGLAWGIVFLEWLSYQRRWTL